MKRDIPKILTAVRDRAEGRKVTSASSPGTADRAKPAPAPGPRGSAIDRCEPESLRPTWRVCYGATLWNPRSNNAPRILILEPDTQDPLARCCATPSRAGKGASVQSTSSGPRGRPRATLERLQELRRATRRLRLREGRHGRQRRRCARCARSRPIPRIPAVILLTTQGQRVHGRAVDQVRRLRLHPERAARPRAGPQRRAARDAAAQEARSAAATAASRGVVRLFGYDMRRCLANHDNVSVHVAFSAERGKEVVLKVLHRGRGSLSRDDNFERFVDEFKLLYDIDDPAVAEIYDFRVTSQYCYIAMEYFPLGHLGQQARRSRCRPREALRYTAEIAHALSIIHTAGVVHRDLKPGNIMLRDDGTVALIDFGISHAMRRGQARPTAADAISGTPYYMSPEQARGEPTDERTDLYALGVILYQMLTGEKLYVGETTRRDPGPAQPRAAAAACRAHLDAHQPLLDRLLAKDVAQRARRTRASSSRRSSRIPHSRPDAGQAQALAG